MKISMSDSHHVQFINTSFTNKEELNCFLMVCFNQSQMKRWKSQTQTIILVLVRYQKPNWPILSADTATNTKTIFKRENLVIDKMGYPKIKFAVNSYISLDYFWRSEDLKILHVSNAKTRRMFGFPIPKPDFGHTLDVANSSWGIIVEFFHWKFETSEPNWH